MCCRHRDDVLIASEAYMRIQTDKHTTSNFIAMSVRFEIVSCSNGTGHEVRKLDALTEVTMTGDSLQEN